MTGCHTNTANAPLSACYEVPGKTLPIQADLSWNPLPLISLCTAAFSCLDVRPKLVVSTPSLITQESVSVQPKRVVSTRSFITQDPTNCPWPLMTYIGGPASGKNSPQCLWAGMHPRANRSHQSGLPDYQATYRTRNGASPFRVGKAPHYPVFSK